jgi:hypothetical protein
MSRQTTDLTQEQIDKIEELYLADVGVSSMAVRVGVLRKHVVKHLKGRKRIGNQAGGLTTGQFTCYGGLGTR